MPASPSSRVTRVSFRAGLLFLGVAILCLLHPLQAASQDARTRGASGQTIVIHGDKRVTPRLRHGFLHGITYTKGKDYSRTAALIADLKPKSWRLASHHNNVYAFVAVESKLPQTQGTEIVFTIQDVFNIRYGWDVKVGGACPSGRKNCFSSYDAFKQAWVAVVHGVMKRGADKAISVDYIEVFAEPNAGTGKLGLTPQQLGDIFKTTHDIVRQYRPKAKIVGPSIAGFGERFLRGFLSFVVENNLRLDALAWHEFGEPELLVPHVNEMRQIFKAQPGLCKPTCPEIHINEYSPYEQHLIPGYGAGWLYYLEAAGVDHANRACWAIPGSGAGASCWAGFNGLLLEDNVTPQPLYWVYKAYADMTGEARVSSESSAPRTVALASRDDAKRELRILAGKYGQKGASGPLAIDVREFPYGAATVTAEVQRIPDTGNRLQALPSPPPARTETIRLQDKAFSIVIPNFRDGEAYSIVVRPGAAGTAQRN